MAVAAGRHDRPGINDINVTVDRKLIRPYKGIIQDITKKHLDEYRAEHAGKKKEAEDGFGPDDYFFDSFFLRQGIIRYCTAWIFSYMPSPHSFSNSL